MFLERIDHISVLVIFCITSFLFILENSIWRDNIGKYDK